MIPLSHGQRRLWFLSQDDDSGALYNSPVAVRLTGGLDVDALSRALRDVLERHEVLRTTFPAFQGEPEQEIHEPGTLDWRLDVERSAAGELAARFEEIVRRPFDLATDLPIRAVLFDLGDEEFVLVVVVHHIAGDGWSMAPLGRDISLAYAARREGRAPDWAPLPVQYADYALWQRELLGDDGDPESLIGQQIGYWRRQLAGAPEELDLPADRPRPGAPSRLGHSVAFQVPAAVHARLAAVARSTGATPFMVAYGALAALLVKVGAGADIVIGTAVAGRTDSGLDDLVGFFVNTLALRTDLSGDPAFREILARVREAGLEAFAHQDVPFERVVEELAPSRVRGRHPLFQVMLTVQNTGRAALALPGVSASAPPSTGRAAPTAAKFDLDVLVSEVFDANGAPAGLRGTLVGSADRFDRSSVDRLADRLTRMFQAVAEDPEVPLSRIEVTTPSERELVLKDWNRPPADRPRSSSAPDGRSVVDLIDDVASRRPDGVAVSEHGRELSFAELADRSDRLARHLLALGVRPESVVAVVLGRGADLVVAILAVLKAGGTYLPVDPEYPAGRIGRLLSDSRPLAVLADRPSAANLDDVLRGPALVVVDEPEVRAAVSGRPGGPVRDDERGGPLDADRAAYVMYTSGSTGRPKGVVVTHGGLANYLSWAAWTYGMSSGDAAVLHSSISFDLTVTSLFVPLVAGGTVVASRRGGIDGLSGLLRNQGGFGLVKIVPAHLPLLGELLDPSAAAGAAARWVVGGEALPPGTVRDWLSRAPRSVVVNEYGPTETVVGCSAFEVTAADAGDLGEVVPIGRPIANTRVYVLDEHLSPAPVGVVGDLYVAGAQVARGYQNLPGSTASRFVACPFAEPGERMYRTGDRARWSAAGQLMYAGRDDEQIKIRGFRIEPAEVEAELVRLPEVERAHVVAREDAEGNRRLVAYVVLAAPHDVAALAATEAELVSRLASTLPGHLVPARVVTLEEFPLTPNGKLDRAALPEPSTDGSSTERVAEDPLQALLSHQFAEALRLDSFGVDDDFFARGGHSLLAVAVVSKVGALLDVALEIGDLFDHPTVAQMADLVRERQSSGSPGPVVPPPSTRPDRLPLSFAQQRIWFLDQLDGPGSTYLIPVAVRLTGVLDEPALQAAFRDVIDRHEILRTTFPSSGGTPYQEIRTGDGWELGHERVEDGAAGRLTAAVRQLSVAPFDLARDLPIRATLMTTGPDEHILVVVLHHIAADGWSWGPLTRDLTQAYTARRNGRAPDWHALPLQYADHAIRQTARSEAGGTALERDLAYWREALDGVPEELVLPWDRPRPPVAGERGHLVGFSVSADLHERLQEFARAEGATLFMALQTGFGILLSRLGAGCDLPVGTVIAGRNESDLDELVGCFVNTLVLRMDLSGDPTVREALTRVRTTALAAYGHQHVPFERLVEEMAPARSLSRHPLFQVMLSLQNTATGVPLTLPGLRASGLEGGDGPTTVKFDLDLTFTETLDAEGVPQGLRGSLVATDDLFDRASIERLAARLVQVFELMTAAPDQQVGGIDVLAAAERSELVESWSGAGHRVTNAEPVLERFARHVAALPRAVAVREGRTEVSYAELDRRSSQIADDLRAHGVEEEDVVALQLPRGIELVTTLLGVLKAGAAYLPLDPDLPEGRLEAVLRDATPSLVLRTGYVLHGADGRRAAPAGAGAPHPAAAAYIVHTSGSTGRPKGVVVTHAGLANTAAALRRFGVTAGSVVAQFASPGFDNFALEWTLALTTGATLVIVPPDRRLGPELAAFLRTEGVTHASLPPAVVGGLDPVHLPDLRVLEVGGEVCAPEVAARWSRGRTLFNTYGPTETTVDATVWRCPPDDATPVRIGRPIAGARVYVLDGRLTPVPPGVVGDLYVAGTGVARGYLGPTALTAERFVACPWGSGERMYRTGDRVRWTSDGDLLFAGRDDEQVKIRGFRIELGEIRAVLAGHPEVRQAEVVIRDDGLGGTRPVGYVVLAENAGPQVTRGVTDFLAARLPAYMVPAVVELTTFPLTANGKLDTAALPAPDRPEAGPRRAPANPREAAVCQAFATVLRLAEVGPDDNFFVLGGHSLLAVVLIEELASAGLRVPVRALFESPTPSRLAAVAAATDLGRLGGASGSVPQGTTELRPEMVPLAGLSAAELDTIAKGVEGGAANVADVYPLTPLQEGMLFHHLLAPGQDDAYVGQTVVELDSRERLEAFLDALRQVIARHDSCRSAIVWKELREPVQVVLRVADLPVIDVPVEPGTSDPAGDLAALTGFAMDLARAPLMDVHTAALGDGRWLALIRLHHILLDHAGIEVLLAEIREILAGRSDHLPEPLPFRDVVARIRSADPALRAAHERFFADLLGDFEEPTTPYGVQDVRGDGADAVRAHQELPGDLADRLRKAARDLAVSPATLWHVAWSRVLATLSGRRDVVFGTVLLGRMDAGPGAERALGLLMNTLPVRARLDGTDLLRTIDGMRRQLAALVEHEHAPLTLAQQASGVAPELPLFTSVLNYRFGSAPLDGDAPDPPAGLRTVLVRERTNYPLVVSIDDEEGGFAISVDAVPPVPARDVADLTVNAVASLIDALEAAQRTGRSRPPAFLDVLGGERRVLDRWNDTAQESPFRSVIEQFDAVVAAAPDAPAVVFEGRTLSFGELDARARRLAARLTLELDGAEPVVAVLLPPGLDLVIGLLAVLRAGAAYLPIEPEFPPHRIRVLIDDIGPCAVVTTDALASLGGDSPVVLVEETAPASAEPAPRPLRPAGAAYVMHTSGSTGTPKGVVITHAALTNHLGWIRDWCPIAPGDRVVFKAPPVFDVSILELFAPLTTGATVVVARPGGHLDAQYLAELVQEQEVNVLFFVPTLLEAFLDEPSAAGCSSLRHVLSGGETLSPALVDRFEATFGDHVALTNLYGPTEVTVDATAWRLDPGREPGTRNAVPIGRPVTNTRAFVLDELLSPVPAGVVGDLYLSGVQVARGYSGRPGLTARRFVACPFAAGQAAPGERMYATGDRAHWTPDGELVFTGREDDQQKLRGYRIEPAEIEAVLTAHALVERVAVVLRKDDPEGPRLVAYVVASSAAGEILPEELRALAAARLPRAWVPSVVIVLEAMPLTVGGKLDRRALPVPAVAVSQRAHGPQDTLEGVVAQLFAEVLRRPEVGVDDDFFALGGHSLLATRLLSRVRTVLHAEPALRVLFEAPTVRGFARRLGESTGEAATRPALTRGRYPGPAPMSSGQRRLWFLDRLDGPGTAYTIPLVVSLDGPLDGEALATAFRDVLVRHEVLRTLPLVVDGEPHQNVVRPEQLDVPFEAVSLEDVPDSERREALNSAVHRAAGHVFDLATDLPVRAWLLRATEEEHVLVVVVHHLAADGWSLSPLGRDLSRAYVARAGGRAPEWTPLPVQYADYAVWQAQVLGDGDDDPTGQLAFWRRRLAGVPPELDLPADRPRPALESHRGHAVPVTVPADLHRRLRAIALAEGVTVFMVLQAAFAALLTRLGAGTDILIGTPVAGRTDEQLDDLVGFFVNTLTLRTDLSGEPDFRELLRRVRETDLGAHAHQDIPFERLVEELAPERSLARHPLFQVVLTLQNVEPALLDFPGVAVAGVPLAEGLPVTARFDLEMALGETTADDGGPAGIRGTLIGSADLFEPPTVADLAGRFVRLLAAAIDEPGRPLGRLDVLAPGEREVMLAAGGAGPAPAHRTTTLADRFQEQADQAPEAVAVLDGSRLLTYGDLDLRANRLARRLVRTGVGPDAPVAVVMERGAELIVALLAVLKAGGHYVPLDAAYPADRIDYVLADVAPATVLADQACASHLAGTRAGSLPMIVVDEPDTVAGLAAEDGSPIGDSERLAPLRPDHLAYVIHTSGSTGRPKGVAITHRNVISLLEAGREAFALGPADTWSWFHSYAFDFSVWELWGALLHGARVSVVPYVVSRSPENFVEQLVRDQVTVLSQTPSAFSQLAAELGPEISRASLRLVIFGGEALDRSHLEAWPVLADGVAPRLVNMYGITETTVHVTRWDVDAERVRSGEPPGIGPGLPGTRVLVLDGALQPVPAGGTGDIYVVGPGLARGYVGRPELTAERFVACPFPDPDGKPGGRMYRSGDRGRWTADGRLLYRGREDDQVKIRGFRIEPGEIQAVLAAHPAVAEAAVVVREDVPGDRRLTGYVVPADGAGAELDEALRRHTAGRLPAHMVPTAFVALDQLPLTAHGKLDRAALPAPRTGPAPSGRGPADAREEAIAQSFADVLGRPSVGVDEDFFALGGHSMLAVTLVERLRAQGVSLSVRALFETPTVAGLAASSGHATLPVPPNRIPDGAVRLTPDMLPLVDLTPEELDRIAARIPGGAPNVADLYPLAPLQEGILFHHLLADGAGPDAYLTPFLLGFDSRTRLDAFLAALQQVVDRHDICRTAVLWEEADEPVQVVLRQAPLPITEVPPANSDVPGADPRARLRAVAGGWMDVTRAPLIDVHVTADGHESWLALVRLHHLALDHTGMDVLLDEIRSILAGRHGDLPAPLPFRDFVVQARGTEERTAGHAAYFAELLGDVDEPTAPYGLLDVRGDGSDARTADRSLDLDLSARLRAVSKAAGASPATVLHVAWARTLSALSGQPDVVFGTVLFGRMDGGAGADRVLGLFMNTLPVRFRIDQDDVLTSVARMRSHLAALLEHEHTPLSAALGAGRLPADVPLFTTLFNARHSPPTGSAASGTETAGEPLAGVRTLDVHERTNYPISVSVDDAGPSGGFGCTVDAVAPADPDLIARMFITTVAAIVTALEKAVTQPETATALRDVAVVSSGERDRLLCLGSGSPPDSAAPPVLSLVADAVATAPGAPAVSGPARSLTYGELAVEAGRVARLLTTRGIGTDAIVGVALDRGPDLIATLLGILAAGAAYLPIDPDHPSARLGFVLDDARPVMVLTSTARLPALSGPAGGRVPLVAIDEPGTLPDGEAGAGLPVAACPDASAAYIVYTSGSTGTPKAVVVTQAGLANTVSGLSRFGAGPGSRVAQFASATFDNFALEWTLALTSGAELVVVPPDARAGEDLVAVLTDHAVTHASLPPAVVADLEPGALPAGLVLEVGGEACPPAVAARWSEDRTLFNTYGPTETTVDATVWRCEPGARVVAIGRPITGVRAFVLDSRLGLVPPGVEGDLYLAGRGLARGYLNRPGLTAGRFVACPWASGERMYRTGDRARWSGDEQLVFAGRSDDQVQIRGHRIEPGEIAEALTRHPQVDQAAVIARADPLGDQQLVGYVVPGPAADVDEQAAAELVRELRAHLTALLPAYLVPPAVVVLPGLPLTPNGKLDRAALPVPAATGAGGGRAPSGPDESALAEIFAEVLGLDRVGADEDFFALGGHSLLATRLIARVRGRLGRDVTLRALFDAPTVEELAKQLGGPARARPALRRIDRKEDE
ncbi:amino acid adenylation domain-containing protein [Actinomadura barringtoniae]|uniref:Amino acid adenylation domain-containing protein n=1 Tax=Actinomadura barringtoniae TaxID=1427535 RepID=A0A939PLI0_9ACTN|nr:non-ribosomal peptide synthetase [Actinomadura barringtoniae]MBO2455157.1 amino acid adenylation domain-containing protein [Actinomadura barringtoniae]